MSIHTNPFENVVVLKFGSSVLRSVDDLDDVVHEIYRHLRSGRRVVAVVSALGNTTNELLEEARSIDVNIAAEHLATHLALGEARSASLLALALDRAGVPAKVTNAHDLQIRTVGSPLDARPQSIDVHRLSELFERASVVIVPGFVGISGRGETTLLGRGGSDLSAAFLAHEIRAGRCILYKDVDGLYERDPKEAVDDEDDPSAPPARRFASIAWEDALRLDDDIIQAKAVLYAFRRRQQIEVAALNRSYSTIIGRCSTRFARSDLVESKAPKQPLRIALLGLGTVGFGVFQHLLKRADDFEIVSILVRNPAKYCARVPLAYRDRIIGDAAQALDADTDLVIEAIGGSEPAASFIREALARGRHVVTANKDVVAHHGAEFRSVAAESNLLFRYGATTGGAVPALESIQKIVAGENTTGERVQTVEAVINGTTNFILDQLIDGRPIGDAVREAQARGFAEVDPTADLEGIDAAHKLCIIAHDAFGVDLSLDEIDRRGITDVDVNEAQRASAHGRIVRLVATCQAHALGRIEARVRPIELPLGHPLAACRGEENAVVIRTTAGRVITINGKGAGRWPTAESVIGDVFEIHRTHALQRQVDLATYSSEAHQQQKCTPAPNA